IRMMRAIVDSARRDQTQSGADSVEKEGYLWKRKMGPTNMGFYTVSRKANAEEDVVSTFMAAVALKSIWKKITGRVDLQLQAAQHILRY
ncbi:hypothetical protein PENTCL1PPCAC_19839, partial [Pristionchus entomophagus]